MVLKIWGNSQFPPLNAVKMRSYFVKSESKINKALQPMNKG